MVLDLESRRRTGRPTVPRDVRTLIRTMSEANPLWGAPWIHGELLKGTAAVLVPFLARVTFPDVLCRTNPRIPRFSSDVTRPSLALSLSPLSDAREANNN